MRPALGRAFEEADREAKMAAPASVFGFFCAGALDLGWVRVTDGLDAFERNHPHEPEHFYLSLLATHPDHAGHGHGHGMGLVAECLAEIAAGDPPCGGRPPRCDLSDSGSDNPQR